MLSLLIDEDDLKLHPKLDVQPSTFHFVCVCDKPVATTTRTGICPDCGREYDISAWGKEPSQN